ncbi:MAG: arginine--tRNA ligase [Candidatus Doudnabacteria bacterium]|nr:arginine--tRNA ligase [Candidatus Doudnabacteria bacterium]
MKQYIHALFSDILGKMYTAGKLSVLPVVELSVPDAQFGDYATNVALRLAKQLGQSPQEIAEKLAVELKSFDIQHRFSEIASVGGFINFTVSKEFLLQNMKAVLDQGELYGSSVAGQGKKVLVEYFQPNVAKPLHLGHISNAVVGDALFHILKSQGYKTESDTHLGDWGTQFGLLLLAYKKYGDFNIIEKNPIDELNKLYVQINTEIESNPEIREQGKQEFVKLEQGDTENRKLWEQFREWSWQEYDIIYSQLGVRKADHDWPESFYEDKMPAVIDELKQKGLLIESQGAQIVPLEDYKLGTAVVIKSDSGTTYLLRDLATYIYRQQQGFEKQLYIIDVRQQHQLAQTFKILELMGHIKAPQDAVHIAYGFLKLPEGAMSSRKGTIIQAGEFIKSVQEKALEIINEKNPDLKDKESVAKQVASGAIKYFQLSHNLKSDIVFDPAKVISFEGNTGPYLQYTHARIHGIKRKAGGEIDISQIFDDKITISEQESAVLRKLMQFQETLETVTIEYTPNLLCNYLFELAQNFNSFYQAIPVTQETDEQLKAFRLQLITATAQVINNGLYVLGIQAPEEM